MKFCNTCVLPRQLLCIELIYQFPHIFLNFALGDFESDPVLIGEETGPCVSLCHSYALLGRCADTTYTYLLHPYIHMKVGICLDCRLFGILFG